MSNKYDKEFHNFIIFTAYPEGLKSLGWQLSNEGYNVIIGQVDDLKSIGIDHKEKPEEKRRRKSPYTGMLNIQDSEELLKRMKKIDDKDDYFVIFDNSMMHSLSKRATDMGFTQGLFPSKFDNQLEDDRSFAKDFVQQYYPDLKVAEVMEFKSIDEGIEFINESDEFWALKGNDVYAPTVVPVTSDIEFQRSELADALRSQKEDFERGGFILERQIRDGIEFCLEQIYYDGELVTTSVDLENKTFGNANLSSKYGCAINLIVEVPNDAIVIPKIFPEVVSKLAKKHKGIYLSDANIIMKDGEMYFLEFCGNRLGMDSAMTQCEMSGSVYDFFCSIANRKSPFKTKFGAAVRAFNLKREKDHTITEGSAIRWKPDVQSHVYPYEIYKNDKGKYLNTGSEENLAVFTGSSDDLEYSIIKAYEVLDYFSFDEIYYRSQADFIDRTYHGNILDRYEAIEALISSPAVEGED